MLLFPHPEDVEQGADSQNGKYDNYYHRDSDDVAQFLLLGKVAVDDVNLPLSALILKLHPLVLHLNQVLLAYDAVAVCAALLVGGKRLSPSAISFMHIVLQAVYVRQLVARAAL